MIRHDRSRQGVHLVLPELKGNLDGYAMRGPTPQRQRGGSDGDHREAQQMESVNGALRRGAEGPMKGILDFTEEELVSADFKGNPHSFRSWTQVTLWWWVRIALRWWRGTTTSGATRCAAAAT